MRTKHTIHSIIAGAGLLLLATPAFALSLLPLSAGKSYPTSHSTCFVNFMGNFAVENSCSTQQYWFIPLAVNQGSHTATLGVYSGGVLSCTLTSVYQTGSPYQSTHWTPPSGYQTGSLSVSSPSSGSVYLLCTMNPGDMIITVNYNE
jgi:hypothetical protein